MDFNKMFSNDGSASWARFGSFLAMICSLVWITYFVFSKTQLADASTLLGHAGFITALYAVGKVNETIQDKKE